MKKIAVVATVVGLSMAMPVPVAQAGRELLSQPPEQSQSEQDFAVGGGQHGAGSVKEGFSAHSGPTGEDPSGHVSATLHPGNTGGQPLELKGPVICLHVVGNQAFIRYVAEKSEVPGFPQGAEVLLRVVDNGNPQGGVSPDLIANIPGGAAPRSPAFPCGFHPFVVPLEKGNIVVQDA